MSRSGLFAGKVTMASPANDAPTIKQEGYCWMEYGLDIEAGPPTPFSFKITTDDVSYQLPLQQYLYDLVTPAVYDFYVDWGNGEPIDHITAWNQSEANHPYFGDTGEYTIEITGNISAFGYVYGGDNAFDNDMVTGFVSWGNLTTHDVDAWPEMWSDCTNMVYLATDAPDLTGVTQMWDMFWYCEALGTGGDWSGWDVSLVEDLDSFFQNCTDFNNASIGGWDVSSNYYFNELFEDSAFNSDISAWTPIAGGVFDNFLRNPSFSTANYDLLLNAWSLLTFDESGFGFGALNVEYTISTSQAARDILTSAPNNWSIVDGGGV